MSYAILRTAKLTTWGNVTASALHNWREQPTPNADPSRTPGNRSNGAQSADELVAGMKARMPAKVRKNAVLGIEYFIGASPEWWEANPREKREGYLDAAEAWLRKRHGSENVIAVSRHYDETSPHICAYVVPIDPDTGKLNASRFLDGAKMLSQMQTEFAEKVGEPFDLERGIEGSKAEHQRVSQFYGHMNRPDDGEDIPPVDKLPPKPPPPTLGERLAAAAGVKTEGARARAAHDAQVQRRIEQDRQAKAALSRKLQRAQVKEIQHAADRAANRARERAFQDLRARAAIVRDLPLAAVLEALGCKIDPKDRNNWRTPVGRLTVTGAKFYAHDVAKGGGGAVDLVALVEGLPPKDAIGWLGRQFGAGEVLGEMAARAKEAVAAAVAEPPRPFVPPAPNPERWPRVRSYLTQTRGLPGELVDQLHAERKVYADDVANAVFVLEGGAGVELRGTGPSPFHGARGSKRLFTLRSLGEKAIAFVESALDALSLRALGFKGAIASTTGSQVKVMQAKAEEARQAGERVFAAFDNDARGDQMAAQLGEAERLRPRRKDWNDDLCNPVAPQTPAPAVEAPEAEPAPKERPRIRPRA